MLTTDQTLLPIPPQDLRKLQATYERRRQSRWRGRRGFETPCVLPVGHGDMKKPVHLSFYAAPEVAIIVMVDEALPLELPDHQRFQADPPPSFRDLLDDIYAHLEDTWSDPPATRYRLQELRRQQREEDHPEDAPSLWSLVFAEGGTWHHE